MGMTTPSNGFYRGETSNATFCSRRCLVRWSMKSTSFKLDERTDWNHSSLVRARYEVAVTLISRCVWHCRFQDARRADKTPGSEQLASRKGEEDQGHAIRSTRQPIGHSNQPVGAQTSTWTVKLSFPFCSFFFYTHNVHIHRYCFVLRFLFCFFWRTMASLLNWYFLLLYSLWRIGISSGSGALVPHITCCSLFDS